MSNNRDPFKVGFLDFTLYYYKNKILYWIIT